MRKLQILVIAGLILILAGSASAQYLGQMAPASCLNRSTGNMGTYLIVAEHAMSVVGQLRYGLGEYVEGRARLGFIDPEGGDVSLILGGDLKYSLWKYKQNENPIDLALGAGLEYSDIGPGSYLSVGGSVIGSIPQYLKNGRSLEPYARLNLRLQRYSWDTPYGDGSDSDFKIGLNVGSVFRVMDLADFTAEVQIDDEMAFMIGIDLVSF